MNHGTMKFLCITMSIWIGFPLSAAAAEAAAVTGESAPAPTVTSENAPAPTVTSENAPAPTVTSESAPAAAGTGESVKAEAGRSERAKVEVGTRTSQWMDTQREGRIPGNLLPIPGAEAGPSYRRYINTFSKPIPDQLLSAEPISGTQK